MMKIIFVFMLSCTFAFAQVSSDKLFYLVELMGLEKSWNEAVLLQVNESIIADPKLKLVRKELSAYMLKKHGWEKSKEQALPNLLESFSVAEVNKLIAIYELPVLQKKMKMLLKLGSLVDQGVGQTLENKDSKLVKIIGLSKERIEKLKKRRK